MPEGPSHEVLQVHFHLQVYQDAELLCAAAAVMAAELLPQGGDSQHDSHTTLINPEGS